MRLSDLPEIDDTLRPYQVSGKKEIYRAWDSCRTVLFQMPTGTGKTRLFSSIIKDIRRLWQQDKKIRKVLVLAHRTELIQQIDETLSDKYGISHGIIKSGVEETWNRDVQVASVQTIVRRLEKWSAKDFAYIIIDEAHHAVSSTYMKICQQFPEAKVLGVTATPCRLTGDALRKLFGVLVVSQPITKFIEQKYLSEYSYYSIKPDSLIQRELDSISHFNVEGDYAEADMMRIVDTNKVRANIVEAYKKYASGKKGIIYTINQQHNKNICEAFEKIGVKIKAIDSKTPTEERKNTVAQFKSGKIDIICNVNIFSEGFDCPDIEFIQLARPTCSLAMYLQQVGRGLRPHPKGIAATILDNVGSYNKFGLPSANRQWRRHFEGQGQRVTQSSLGTGAGARTPRKITEGDEDMMLIFNGKSTIVEQSTEVDILNSILDTKEWFPFGSTVLLDPYSGMFNVRKLTKAGCWYGDYEDQQDWLDAVEDEIDTARGDLDNEGKEEEINWVDRQIHRMFKFSHQGKYGLCQLHNDPSRLSEDIELCRTGKKKTGDVLTMLLPPIYDEIGVPDDQGRAICVKDGKYGVLSSESYLPIVSFQYEELEFQANGLYLAMKDGKVGLIKGDQEIIPIEHEEIVDLAADIDKQYYLISEGDHYKLVLFKNDYQANTQNKLPIKQHLKGALYLGLSTQNHGFICNSLGEILYPLYFERIGITSKNKNGAFVLGIRKIAFILKEDLSHISESIQCEQSHDGFIDQFELEKLFVVIGKSINERARKKKTDSSAQSKQVDAVGITGDSAGNSGLEKVPEEHSDESKQTPAPPVLPVVNGVFKGDNGKYGLAYHGKALLDAEYDEITPIGNNRLIAKKEGKYGVISIDNEAANQVVDFLFNKLVGAKNHQYRIMLAGGHFIQRDEAFLQTVLLQTDKCLVVDAPDGTLQIIFRDTLVNKYQELNYLGENVFIAKNFSGKYGIIRCHSKYAETVRPFEYNDIQLSKDGQNVLLYKTGRPRFIPVRTLLTS